MWQYFLSFGPKQLCFFQVYKGKEKHVSRAAHAFGAATGLLVGFFILKNRKVSNRSRKLQIGALIIFGISVGILCIWHLAGGSGGDDSWFNQNLVRDSKESKISENDKICPH